MSERLTSSEFRKIVDALPQKRKDMLLFFLQGRSPEDVLVAVTDQVPELLPERLQPTTTQDAEAGLLKAPLMLCTHCNRQIAWEYGDWWHTDSDLKECDPDDWVHDYAEPVDDPAVRAFASELEGRRIRLTSKIGEQVTGTLFESADWAVTVMFPLGAAEKMRKLRVEHIRHVQPLEQDGPAPLDRYAAAIADHFTDWTRGKTPAVGTGISLDLPGLGAVMTWNREVGWYIYRLGPRGQRTRLRFLGAGQLTPTAEALAKAVRAWERQPASLPAIRPSYGPVVLEELDALLVSAVTADDVHTEPCDECEGKGRNCSAHGGRPGIAPVYPAPGSAIPGMPGYVVATCSHRVAAMEWRAGFRVCERCPDEQDAEGGR